MAEFKVGDRVVATENHDGGIIKGLCGTVVCFDSSGRVGIEFDAPILASGGGTLGHFLGGRIGTPRGWYVTDRKLKLSDSPAKPDWDWDVVFEEINGIIDIAEQESKRVSEPPKLDATNLLKCIIASKSYPYATLDATGVLYFYSDLPKGIVVFETTAVKR